MRVKVCVGVHVCVCACVRACAWLVLQPDRSAWLRVFLLLVQNPVSTDVMVEQPRKKWFPRTPQGAIPAVGATMPLLFPPPAVRASTKATLNALRVPVQSTGVHAASSDGRICDSLALHVDL